MKKVADSCPKPFKPAQITGLLLAMVGAVICASSIASAVEMLLDEKPWYVQMLNMEPTINETAKQQPTEDRCKNG